MALSAARAALRAPLAVRSVASSTRALRTAAPAASLLSDKTGQTGAAVLGGGLAAYLVSKEVIIFHAETVVVAAIGAVTYGIMHKFGPEIAGELDGRAKGIHDALAKGREAQISAIKAEIAEQEALKESLKHLPTVYDINAELNDMSRELAYRTERQTARDSALKQLGDVLGIETQQRAAEQASLVAWVEDEVRKALKGKEDQFLKQAVAELEAMAAK